MVIGARIYRGSGNHGSHGAHGSQLDGVKNKKMGVLDAIQKNCEPRKNENDQDGRAVAESSTESTTQPGWTSGASCPPGPPRPSVALDCGPQAPPALCRSCGLPAAWELVYDGSLRCPECEPPPGRSLVRRWWTIWLRPREPGDVIPPGFATARFSGAGLVPEWIEMDAPRKF